MNSQSNAMESTSSRQLPVKTKAAMWFMFVVAGIEVLYGAWSLAHYYYCVEESGWEFLSDLLFTGLYVLPASVLLRKSRFAFIAAVSILSLYLIFLIYGIAAGIAGGYNFGHYLGGSIFVLVPLILLALDAKNYWNITV